MSSGKTRPGERFATLVAAIEAHGPLEATVLASFTARAPASSQATQAAQHLVGGVNAIGSRIDRIAHLLDKLRVADRADAKRRAS